MYGRFVRLAVVPALLFGTFGALSAQATGTITGTVVVASSSQPLPGAQVNIPASNQGMLSNNEGRFILLNVAAGQQVVHVQLIGYAQAEKTVTVPAGGTVTVNFKLKEQAVAVGGLVVTALGVQRSKRSLGYAVQDVTQSRLADAPQVNVTSALAGKVAGLQVLASSSRPGASNQVIIRGVSSFTGNTQPLYVIDGTPVNMGTDNQGGFGPNSGEAGSRSMDIDMNNVQSISVLRGAAATALYGSRAAHGAIIITTKKGQPGAPVRFQVNARYQMQKPLLKGYQTQYTAGQGGYYCNGLPEGLGGWCESGYYKAGFTTPTTGTAFGPRYDSVDAEVMQHECPGVTDPSKCIRMQDPRKDFYRTGAVLNTSLAATGGLPHGGSFNLEGSWVDNQGITPNESLKRLSLNANVELPLTDRVKSNTIVMYSNTDNVWLNEGWQSVEQELWYRTPNLDVRKAWNSDGTPVMWGTNTPHPDWVATHEHREGTTGRWIASQRLQFDVLHNVQLYDQLGYDTYLDSRVYNQDVRPWLTAIGQSSGTTRQEHYTRSQLNNDLVLTLANTALPFFKDIQVSGLAGFNVLQQENAHIMASGTDIIIPGYYNVNNFLTETPSADLTQKRRTLGLYSQVTLDYRDWAFLNASARNDWSSTLPVNNDSYFYPSLSLGIVFTDALGIHNKWLNYGKLRFSVAKVGSDAPPYSLATTYYNPTFSAYRYNFVHWPFDGTQGFLQSSQLGNPTLKPESDKEYETGLEMRMLNDRAHLDLTYYDKMSYDQIFSVPSSYATGYSSITRNAGNLKNNGWEASLELVPIQTPKMRWDVNVNWTKNTSTVVSLAPGVVSIHLAGYSFPDIEIRKGKPYGVIWGTGFQRDSITHKVLIDDNPSSSRYGWPLLTDQPIVLGSMDPNWLGNIYSSFQYGPFTLSGVVSTVQGGQGLDFTLNYTIGRGVSSLSLNRGTSFVYPGVLASNHSQANNITITRDQNYYQNQLGGYLNTENYVKSASATRLQELTLQYRLPARIVNVMGAGSATFFVTGNNLHVWSSWPEGDPQGSNYGDTNSAGQYYHMFTAPMESTYTFGLRANF